MSFKLDYSLFRKSKFSFVKYVSFSVDGIWLYSSRLAMEFY